MGKNNKFSRRAFIEKMAHSTAAFFMFPLTRKSFAEKFAEPLAKSRVVVVKHEQALSGSAFNQDVIEIMMDAGITTLTGISDVGEAWKSIFPGITSSSVIAIKINCLFPQMSTHPSVANALLASLKKMRIDGNPFPENNIILWDNYSSNMRNAGFTINKTKTGVRYFGTDGQYDSTVYPIDGGDGQRLSKIITDQCNYLINFSVLKNHWTSGVSLSLKNHYGSIHRVDGNGMHDNVAELPIASLNALQPIRDKQVICICDAIKGTISGGPSAAPQVAPKSLIFSRDTVAHDYIGTQILKDYGASNSDTSLTIMAKHIAAAANRYHLGTCDPNLIERIDVNNPTTSIEEPRMKHEIPNGFILHQNYPNPFNGTTFINYELPESAMVRIRILNAKGETVRQLFEGRQGPGWFQLTWNGKRVGGSTVPSGIYLCSLETGRVRRIIKMHLIQ